MDIMIASEEGIELGYLDIDKSVDIDIGGTNDYAITAALSDWAAFGYGYGQRLYIPDTEYGGFIQDIKTGNAENEVVISGFTWRGMLAYKVIEPPLGQAYKTVSGEANSVLKSMLDGLFDGVFVVAEIDSGIVIHSYQFDRYTDLLTGLTKMLYSAGAKLQIRCKSGTSGGRGYVELQAVPVVDYSDELEYSENSRISFTTRDVRNGINHLICLGKGELQDREVVHLYVQADGTIGSAQYYTGLDERVATYDYGNVETTEELIKGGRERLNELQDFKQFDMAVGGIEADIGDIVGGREYTTGFLIRQQITEKIVRIENDDMTIEYKVGGSIKSTQNIGGGGTDYGVQIKELQEGKSDINHVHDDRYYTEAETNTLFRSSHTINDRDDCGIALECPSYDYYTRWHCNLNSAWFHAFNKSDSSYVNNMIGFELATGKIKFGNEVSFLSPNALRMVYGNYGAFFRNDGGQLYLMLTDSGKPYGSYNSLRPFYVDLSNGRVHMNNGIDADTIYTNDWFRSTGATGWYNQTYDGGWYMADSTWIRAYNDKNIYTGGLLQAGAGVQGGAFFFNNGWTLADINGSGFVSLGYGAYANNYHLYIYGRDIGFNPRSNDGNSGTPMRYFRENSSSAAGRTILRPDTNGGAYLGTTGYRWNTAFFTNAITQSDRKTKNNIQPIEKAKEFILSLNPVEYTLIDGDSDQTRKHMGLIAQEVSETAKDLQMGDLSLYQASIITDDGEEQPYRDDARDDQLSWGLNYNEFIAPLIVVVQQQHEEISQLKKEIESLKGGK